MDEMDVAILGVSEFCRSNGLSGDYVGLPGEAGFSIVGAQQTPTFAELVSLGQQAAARLQQLENLDKAVTDYIRDNHGSLAVFVAKGVSGLLTQADKDAIAAIVNGGQVDTSSTGTGSAV